MIHTKDFKQFFPFPKIRKCQRKAIKFILNEFLNNDKKFVILEAGTGVGKSAIGVTVSRFLQNYNKQHKIINQLPEDNIVIINQKEQEQETKKKQLLKNRLNQFRFKQGSKKDSKEKETNQETNKENNQETKQENNQENKDIINYINSSYFLTTQKILQKQYIEDFKKPILDIEDLGKSNYEMKTISSATNYKCSFYPSVCCSQGQRALKIVDKKSKFFKSCSKQCKYKLKKKQFLQPEKDGVTNFSYFLAETMYSKQLKPKELLVIDECHNLYQELCDFIDIDLTSSMLEKVNLTFPDSFHYSTKTEVSKWIRFTFLSQLTKLKHKISKLIENEVNGLDKSKNTENSSSEEDDYNEIDEILSKYTNQNHTQTNRLQQLVQQNESLDKIKCKTNRFLKYYEPDNWVINYTYEKKLVKEEIKDESDIYETNENKKKKKEIKVKSISSYFTKKDTKNTKDTKDTEIKTIQLKKKRYRKVYKEILTKIDFKPIDISKYSKQLLFDYGFRVLMMSATILNKHKFCELIGLQPKDVSFLSIPSPFPPENKPIMYCPVGNMGLQTIEDNIPKLIRNIKKILKIHKNDKGIIHCHSYKITNYIIENIQSKRLLSHDSTNRDKILRRHIHSKRPTVLLSPSMEEGVDLKDNISRFQIICKIPYPYLGDNLVVERMKKWNWWYSFETIKKIVQSIGRSIRSETDFAKTYILDKCWERFYYENKSTFPINFDKQFVTKK